MGGDNNLIESQAPINFCKTYNLNQIVIQPTSLLETFDDLDDKLHAFNLLFNKILQEHGPVKAIRLRGRPNPSITDDIRKLMATRDKWKRDFKQTKVPFAWSIYKNLSQEVKREIRLVEKGFIRVVKGDVFSFLPRPVGAVFGLFCIMHIFLM